MKINNMLRKVPVITWVLISIFFLYLFTSRGGYDGYELENYLTAENIFLHHQLSIAPGYSNLPGVQTSDDGSPTYIRHNLAQPLLEVPLYALGYFSPVKLPQLKVDSSVSNVGNLSTTTLLSVSLFNIIATVLTVYLVYLFSRRMLKNEMQAILMGIIYGIGTIAWPYSAIGLEPLMVLSLFSAFYFLYTFKDNHKSYQIVCAAISIAILINSKLYAYIFVGPFFLYAFIIFYRNKKLFNLKNIVLLLIPITIGLSVFSLFNLFRFGNILGSFATTIGYSFIFENLLAYAISTGKGIIVYSPMIILTLFSLKSFYRTYKTESIIIALITACLLIVILPSWFIRIDEMWGPRYANVLVPFFVLISSSTVVKLLESLKGRLALAVLLGISIWIQLVGLSFFGNLPIEIAFQAGVKNIDEAIYIPKLSPIVIGSELYAKTVYKNLTGHIGKFSYTYIPGTSASDAVLTDSLSVNLEKDAHFITLPYRAFNSKLKEVTVLFHIFILAYVFGVLSFLLKSKKLRGIK